MCTAYIQVLKCKKEPLKCTVWENYLLSQGGNLETLQTHSRMRILFQERQRLGKECQGSRKQLAQVPSGGHPCPAHRSPSPPTKPSHPSGVSRYLREDPPLSKGLGSRLGLQGAPARNSAVRSNPKRSIANPPPPPPPKSWRDRTARPEILAQPGLNDCKVHSASV